MVSMNRASMSELEDPSLLLFGVGNVFVKNLDSSIDNTFLHKVFSSFGNIQSCKVATNNQDGSSYAWRPLARLPFGAWKLA